MQQAQAIANGDFDTATKLGNALTSPAPAAPAAAMPGSPLSPEVLVMTLGSASPAATSLATQASQTFVNGLPAGFDGENIGHYAALVPGGAANGDRNGGVKDFVQEVDDNGNPQTDAADNDSEIEDYDPATDGDLEDMPELQNGDVEVADDDDEVEDYDPNEHGDIEDMQDGDVELENDDVVDEDDGEEEDDVDLDDN